MNPGRPVRVVGQPQPAFASGSRDIASILRDAGLAPLRRRADFAARLWDLADGLPAR